MAFVNMFNDRVEQFNLREENERLAELFSDEKLQEEAQWQAYSVKEISRLFSISEEEALKLMNCGLFKTYRVGNEYRASKKSVEENKKIVKAVLTYQDKKTMSVPDVMRILGLGKTATYRLINQCRFKTYLVLGKMRVDVDSFEDWYAGQFHYEKVNGERPGKKYGKTLSPLTVAKVLGIPRSTAIDFTLWLAEEDNLALLADAVGLEITFDETESSVGDFNVDIYATETGTDRKTIIENQLEDTDHDHLGKLITYASGKSADIVIWVVKRAREEHRSAIEWLNNHTDENIALFLVEIKLYQIGSSDIAVKFEVVEKPNDWTRKPTESLYLIRQIFKIRISGLNSSIGRWTLP